jgi:hypothetical protein
MQTRVGQRCNANRLQRAGENGMWLFSLIVVEVDTHARQLRTWSCR